MERVSAAASRSLPSKDASRWYKHCRDAPDEAKVPTCCRCTPPERPDTWPDAMWRKYLITMARLPCKPCGWAGGVPPRQGTIIVNDGITAPTTASTTTHNSNNSSFKGFSKLMRSSLIDNNNNRINGEERDHGGFTSSEGGGGSDDNGPAGGDGKATLGVFVATSRFFRNIRGTKKKKQQKQKVHGATPNSNNGTAAPHD